ncbi:MAG: hypothetical protein MK066_00760 [Crocinitomicaceae bacterium]|nr:hypothetical protein [Crocinitomicaceae bacterium]
MTTIQIISIILSIICFGTIIYVGLKTDLLRAKKTSETEIGCYSFGRFQLWIWTLVITPIFTLYWGFLGTDVIPDINTTALILLGIPIATKTAAHIVQESHEKTTRETQPQGPLTNLKHHRQGHSFWFDILSDDMEQLSIARLQSLMFTMIYLVIYVTMFFEMKLISLPEFGNKAYLLMGISSGGYILGKSLKK